MICLEFEYYHVWKIFKVIALEDVLNDTSFQTLANIQYDILKTYVENQGQSSLMC